MMSVEDAPSTSENDANIEITGLELLGYEDPDEHNSMAQPSAAQPRKMTPSRAKSAPIRSYSGGDSDSDSYASSTAHDNNNNTTPNSDHLGYGITRTDYGDRNSNSAATGNAAPYSPRRAPSPHRGGPGPPMNLARVRRRVSIGNAEAGIMQTHWGHKPRRRASLTTTSSSQAAVEHAQQQRVPRRQSIASASSSGGSLSSYSYAADSIDLRRSHQLQEKQQHDQTEGKDISNDTNKKNRKAKSSSSNSNKPTSSKKKKKKKQGKGLLDRFFQNKNVKSSNEKSPPQETKKQPAPPPPSPTKPMTDEDSGEEDSYAKDSVMMKAKPKPKLQQQNRHNPYKPHVIDDDNHDDSTCGSSYAKDSVMLKAKTRAAGDDFDNDDSSLDDSYAKDSVMLKAKVTTTTTTAAAANDEYGDNDSSTCGSSYAKDSVMLRAKAMQAGEDNVNLEYNDDSTCGSSYAKDSVVFQSKSRPVNYDDDEEDGSTCGDSYAKDSVMMKPKPRPLHADEEDDDDDSSCPDDYARDSVHVGKTRQYRSVDDDDDDSDADTYANDSVMMPKKKPAAAAKPVGKDDRGLGYVPHAYHHANPYAKRNHDDDDEDEEDSVCNDYLTNAVLGYSKVAIGGPGSNQAMRRESIDSVLTDCCSYAEDSVCGGSAKKRTQAQHHEDEDSDDDDDDDGEEEDDEDDDDENSVKNDYLTNAVLGYSKTAFDIPSTGGSIGKKAPRRESIDSDCCSYAEDSVVGGAARSRIQPHLAAKEEEDHDDDDNDDGMGNDPLMNAVLGYSKNAFGNERQPQQEEAENTGSDYLMDAVMSYSKNAFPGDRGKDGRRELDNSIYSACDSYADDRVTAHVANPRPKVVVHVDVDEDDDDASSLGYESGRYLSGLSGDGRPSSGRRSSIASVESDCSYACDSVAGPAKKPTSNDPKFKDYLDRDDDDASMEEDPLDNFEPAVRSAPSKKSANSSRINMNKGKLVDEVFDSDGSEDLDPEYLEQVLGYSLSDFGGTAPVAVSRAPELPPLENSRSSFSDVSEADDDHQDDGDEPGPEGDDSENEYDREVLAKQTSSGAAVKVVTNEKKRLPGAQGSYSKMNLSNASLGSMGSVGSEEEDLFRGSDQLLRNNAKCPESMVNNPPNPAA